MKAGQREIFYLSAPSRQLAENSPYYENLKKAETEVILSYISSSFSKRDTAHLDYCATGALLLRAIRRASADAAAAVR